MYMDKSDISGKVLKRRIKPFRGKVLPYKSITVL